MHLGQAQPWSTDRAAPRGDPPAGRKRPLSDPVSSLPLRLPVVSASEASRTASALQGGTLRRDLGDTPIAMRRGSAPPRRLAPDVISSRAEERHGSQPQPAQQQPTDTASLIIEDVSPTRPPAPEHHASRRHPGRDVHLHAARVRRRSRSGLRGATEGGPAAPRTLHDPSGRACEAVRPR